MIICYLYSNYSKMKHNNYYHYMGDINLLHIYVCYHV